MLLHVHFLNEKKLNVSQPLLPSFHKVKTNHKSIMQQHALKIRARKLITNNATLETFETKCQGKFVVKLKLIDENERVWRMW